MKTLTYRFALGGVAMAAAVGFAAIPASAATARQAVTRHSSSSAIIAGAKGGPKIKAGLPTSPVAAGVAGIPSNGILSVTSTFTAPTFTCYKTTDIEDFSVGPYVFDSNGNNDLASDIQFVCDDGSSAYYLSAFASTSGNDYAAGVNPGDLISTTINENGTTGETTVTTVDLTTGFSETASQTNGADGNPDAEFLLGVYTYEPHIPTFTKVIESNSFVNGLPCLDQASEAFNLKSKTTVQVKASAPSVTSLELTFKSNK